MVLGIFAVGDEIVSRQPHMFDLLPGGVHVAIDFLAGTLDGEVFKSDAEPGMSLALTQLAGDGLS